MNRESKSPAGKHLRTLHGVYSVAYRAAVVTMLLQVFEYFKTLRRRRCSWNTISNLTQDSTENAELRAFFTLASCDSILLQHANCINDACITIC